MRHELRKPGKSHSVAMGSGCRHGGRRRTHGANAAAHGKGTRPGGAPKLGRHPGELAELYGYVNRSFPDSELDAFVDALATRIGSFEKWAISNTKRLVNAASL